MSLSKRAYGVKGWNNGGREAFNADLIDTAKRLEAFGRNAINDKDFQTAIVASAKPVRDAMQLAYVSQADKSGMAGDIALEMKIYRAKRNTTVYVGPDKKSKGFRLAWILNFGTVIRQWKNGKSVGVMPAGRYIEKAVSQSKELFFYLLEKNIKKRMAITAKKLGFDVNEF